MVLGSNPVGGLPLFFGSFFILLECLSEVKFSRVIPKHRRRRSLCIFYKAMDPIQYLEDVRRVEAFPRRRNLFRRPSLCTCPRRRWVNKVNQNKVHPAPQKPKHHSRPFDFNSFAASRFSYKRPASVRAYCNLARIDDGYS